MKRRRPDAQDQNDNCGVASATTHKVTSISEIIKSFQEREQAEKKILKDLSNAVETLCAFRKRQKDENKNDSETIQGPNKPSGTRSNVDFIPSLVNRIIAESSHPDGCPLTAKVRESLMSLLFDFVEPCLIQEFSNFQADNMVKQEVPKSASSEKYNKRAVQWAMDRIRNLLQPPKDTDIPELDALLASTGPHDSFRHEKNMQDKLLGGIEKSRSLLLKSDGKKLHCIGPGANDEALLLEERVIECKNDIASIREIASVGVNADVINKPSDDAQAIDQEEIWSQCPKKWMAQLFSSSDDERNSLKQSDYCSAEEKYPFLAQMRVFLEKHEKEELIIKSL